MKEVKEIVEAIKKLGCSDDYIDVLKAIRENMERDISDWMGEQDALNPDDEKHFDNHQMLQSMIDYMDEFEPRLKRIIEQMQGEEL